jgi:ABC-type polysaccharide/polyol phosphate export permease
MTSLDAQIELVPPALVVTAAKGAVEIRGGRGHVTTEALRELWRARDVLGAFALRQVKVKYKQAIVGIGWAVVQPVTAALLFALFLGNFTHIESEGVAYVVFALAGTVAWTYFATATIHSMDSLVIDQALLRKVYFPREVLPIASILSALVDFVPALATVMVACAIVGIEPSLAWLAVPVPLLLLMLAALAMGLALSAVNIYYRDVRMVLPFVLQLGLFVSPVVFSLDVIPAKWRTAYAVVNPVAAAIDGLRRTLVHQTWPDPTITLLALAWCLVLVAAAYALFKRLERGFADRI